ncbi:LPS export ABC transporter permease LptG [Ciceribacter sp. L1K23]|uniref:LPS export ABC transporter permease LptG n=1 Tax=unclassified Ciceribacter TaxID=2628820 RepID=UPI001ABE473D|nr:MULTISPECIES: LPS export ABC transporter permease LptG [unclassified Ciceribacter]MBO3759702.1 LPS export ABC transporter permease LptG [Ciceribacter sp. L1K22]MBR0556142.1 LPS export ABC transporter permease LptG [Ciceribacter sp. L1K23]
MITTLGRYFLKRYVVVTLWFFLGVASITFLIDFSETTGRFSDLDGFTVAGALYLTALRLPLIFQQTVPFITLFVGMTVLIALNRKSELVVARAAGISVWQFMTPFVLGAFVVGLVTTFALNPLAAWGQRQALQTQSEWRQSGNNASSRSIPWLRQISGNQDVILGARTVMEEGTLLVDAVLIHFDGDGRIILRQDAASAKLKEGYWLLNDVTETRPGEIPTRLATAKVDTNLQREFVQERLATPETVAFYDLSNKIAVARSFGVSTKALETQYHSLISLPLLLVAMTLIAATVSLKFSRFNQSRSVILGGILSGFVLYVVSVLVRAFGSSGVVPPFVAAWVPVVVALSLGATILLHQEDG